MVWRLRQMFKADNGSLIVFVFQDPVILLALKRRSVVSFSSSLCYHRHYHHRHCHQQLISIVCEGQPNLYMIGRLQSHRPLVVY